MTAEEKEMERLRRENEVLRKERSLMELRMRVLIDDNRDKEILIRQMQERRLARTKIGA